MKVVNKWGFQSATMHQSGTAKEIIKDTFFEVKKIRASIDPILMMKCVPYEIYSEFDLSANSFKTNERIEAKLGGYIGLKLMNCMWNKITQLFLFQFWIPILPIFRFKRDETEQS